MPRAKAAPVHKRQRQEPGEVPLSAEEITKHIQAAKMFSVEWNGAHSNAGHPTQKRIIVKQSETIEIKQQTQGADRLTFKINETPQTIMTYAYSEIGQSLCFNLVRKRRTWSISKLGRL